MKSLICTASAFLLTSMTLLGQVESPSPQSSNNTGFATKGAHIIYLSANLQPNGFGLGYSQFIADRFSLGVELNGGVVIYDYQILTTRTDPWTQYSHYEVDHNYYYRTFFQPGIKCNFHFSKHRVFDWYATAGLHPRFYVNSKTTEEDEAIDLEPAYFSIGLGFRWWLSKHISLFNEYGYGNGVVKLGLAIKY